MTAAPFTSAIELVGFVSRLIAEGSEVPSDLSDEQPKRLTKTIVDRVVAAGAALQEVPEVVRPHVQQIVEKHGVFNPSVIRDLGQLPIAQVQEVLETGVLATRALQPNTTDNIVHVVPVGDAGATDVAIFAADGKAQQRYITAQLIHEKAAERHAKRGIVMVYKGTLEITYDPTKPELMLEALRQFATTHDIPDGSALEIGIHVARVVNSSDK